MSVQVAHVAHAAELELRQVLPLVLAHQHDQLVLVQRVQSVRQERLQLARDVLHVSHLRKRVPGHGHHHAHAIGPPEVDGGGAALERGGVRVVVLKKRRQEVRPHLAARAQVHGVLLQLLRHDANQQVKAALVLGRDGAPALHQQHVRYADAVHHGRAHQGVCLHPVVEVHAWAHALRKVLVQPALVDVGDALLAHEAAAQLVAHHAGELGVVVRRHIHLARHVAIVRVDHGNGVSQHPRGHVHDVLKSHVREERVDHLLAGILLPALVSRSRGLALLARVVACRHALLHPLPPFANVRRREGRDMPAPSRLA